MPDNDCLTLGGLMDCAANVSMGVTKARNNKKATALKKTTALKKVTAFIYNLDRKIGRHSLPQEQNKKATFYVYSSP